MRLSTAVELAGFGLLAYAAWLLAPVAGLFTAAGCLLLIGYATDDAAAVLAVRRLQAPVARRRAAWRAKRAAKNSE